MEKPGLKKIIIALPIILFLIGFTLFNQGEALSKVPEGLPGPGAVLPAFSVMAPKNPAYRSYLRLDKETTLKPGELDADLIIIEVFNVYCASCNFMAPYMNELFAKINKDPELKDHVKMMGIGAGNDIWDISDYEDRYNFPIVPDDEYKFHNLVGQPPTPFLIFAKPYGQGRLIVVDTHLGRLADSDKLLSMARKAFETDISTIAVAPGKERPSPEEEGLVMPISESDLIEKVRQSLSLAGEIKDDIKKILLPEFGTVYEGVLKKSNKPIFARIVSRKIPCMDCHNIFYVYSFDSEGKFLYFIPIEIFKLDNEEWDEEDVAKIQNHFKGKSLLEDMHFNPKVDAVTSATISSELIFDSMGKTRQVLEKLIELGYIQK